MTDKRKVTIEYCTSWGYLAKAASLAEKILHDHHETIASVTLIPSSGGVHEVTLDDELIYSKKATGKHPDPDEVLEKIAS